MIELPGSLAPWAPQLSVLSTDLALALAPWLGRLTLAVGPLQAQAAQKTGEPDGYHGIARRGSYERMLVTEWGLAEMFPDEFVRRAAMGEQLFLELARREPRGALRSIAIVSAGPSQLGAPRLAHLAGLIVLARRAAAAGAGFSWGVLEDGAHQLCDALDEDAIRRLLLARTATWAEPEAFTAWLDAVGGDVAREAWFIGGAEHAAAARRAGASCLVVDDPLEPAHGAIDLEVHRRGGIAALRLELPPAAQCARMLRDPFRRNVGGTAVAAAGTARSLRFSADGKKLLVQLTDGAILRWPIPNSPRDKPGAARRWAPPRGHIIVAAGIVGHSMITATATRADPTSIELHRGSGPTVRVLLPSQVAAALSAQLAAPAAPGACALLRLRQRAERDLILDVAGQLLVVSSFAMWPPANQVLTALQLNRTTDGTPHVLAAACSSSSVVWAERRDAGPIRILRATESGNQLVRRIEPSLDVAHFGFAHPDTQAGWGAIAVAIDDELWVVGSEQCPPILLRTSDRVVGVCCFDARPMLLTLPHPYRLFLQRPDRGEPLLTSAGSIVAVAVCTHKPLIAWLTDAGLINVYSMAHRMVVGRLYVGKQAPATEAV